MKIEICLDNLESIETVNQFSIDRIELCSALPLGGLTPNYGFLKQAIALSKAPIALMIRPRAGDFIYSSQEINAMINDIQLAKEFGVQSVVFGALTAQAELDLDVMKHLAEAAQGMEIVCHRAFDLCHNPYKSLDQLIALGFHRLLTSGQATSAFEGIPTLQKLVQQADGHINIMAGCGVNAANVNAILEQTQVSEIHFSAKGQRPSVMKHSGQAKMGNHAEQDSLLDITDITKVSQILAQIESLHL